MHIAQFWFHLTVQRSNRDEQQLKGREGLRVNLVIVSNRVARSKPNEPMAGGLAVVEHSEAIWVFLGTCARQPSEGAVCLALQLRILERSESMGNHDSGSDDWWRVC